MLSTKTAIKQVVDSSYLHSAIASANGFESLSKGTLESILPVQIENEELADDYATYFYPPRKAKVGFPEQKNFYQIFTYLGDVSTTVNLLLAQIRYIYESVPDMLSSGVSMKVATDRVLSNFKELQKSPEINKDNADAPFSDSNIAVTMGACSSGRGHFIKPSTRFKGGYDIIFAGIPGSAYGGSTGLWNSYFGNKNQILILEEGESEFVKASSISNKICLEMANLVLKTIFGAVPSEKAHERAPKQVSIKAFDFKGLMSKLDALMSKAGLGSIFGKLDIMPIFPEEIEKNLSKYFSFTACREPSMAVLEAKKKSPAVEDEELGFNLKVITALQAEISFGFAVNIPEEIASFIAQTSKGSKLPLASLNTWVNAWSRAIIRVPRSKTASGGDKVTVKQCPRYIILPSETGAISKKRKELGLFAEPGRSNEDNLFVSATGRFNYCPPADTGAFENAKNYEALQEQALQISFDAGSPFISSQTGYTSNFYALTNENYKAKIKDVKANISKYAGTLQTYSWDYNCILTSSKSDPDRLVSIPLSGAIKPDALAFSEYLAKPAKESLLLLHPSLYMMNKKKKVEPDSLNSGRTFFDTPLIKNIGELYAYLLFKGKVPNLQELVDKAAKKLGITTLDESTLKEDDPLREILAYEKDLYTTSTSSMRSAQVLDSALKVQAAYIQKPIAKDFVYNRAEPSSEAAFAAVKGNLDNQFLGIKKLAAAAADDASGHPRSNLTRVVLKANEAIVDDPHYFEMVSSSYGEMSNLYNYLGGQVFYQLLLALKAVDKKDLMVVDLKNPMPMVSYQDVVKDIMPFVAFASTYLPKHKEIKEEAEKMSEDLIKDSSITADDIHMPGSKKSFQMFPHQIASHQTLRRNPRFATLDVAPGGGKTILLLSDIGSLIYAGKIKRACILCPNGLVKNYIEDLHSVTEGRWNIIPITTQTYSAWGDERLTEMIKKAPVNTLFVVGLSLLSKTKSTQIVIGNHVEKVSEGLEFCKKFGFEYVCLDESHKAKNTHTAVHKAVKQLTILSTVKYVRIATGTLIQTKLTDVVGQAALFGSHIFRTKEEYIAENSIDAGEGRATVFRKDTPYRARMQLAKHSAVISMKKKEWAFMLPRPIETFLSVTMDTTDEQLKIDDKGGRAHQEMYDVCLKIALDEIKKDKAVLELMSGKEASDDDDDEEENEEEEDLGNKSKGPAGMTTSSKDLDDSSLEELGEKLQTYLARLEQLLSDPLGDPFGEEYFKNIGMENFVSRKVRKIVERVKLNFVDFPWKKGGTYKLKDVADFEGMRYCLMGEKGKTLTLESYEEEYKSVLAPNKDPRWKPEPFGKVIVFCRYNRSVDAIYRALPPDLKKIAVTFNGTTKDKWKNFEDFRTTPYSRTKNPQILIANEQAISEGHNLQMASRIVRCESPWSPGELDQSSSRIFRPDTSGEFRRENIYLDWVLCSNTLEVAKLGRLISRMVDKAKFDEAENPLYSPLSELELAPISMSMETIAATPRLEDIGEYIDNYQLLIKIQSSEFEDLRQTRPATMFSIPQTEMPKGSAIIEQVPYVSGMKFVPDRNNLGLVKLSSWLNTVDDVEVAKVQKDKQKLVGQYVHTEMGNGVITKVNLVRGEEGDKNRKISRIYVLLANGDVYDGDQSMIYLAQNVTKENVKLFSPKSRWAKDADKKNAAKTGKVVSKFEEKEEKKSSKNKAKFDELIEAKKKQRDAKNKLKGIKPISKKKVEEVKSELDLYPVVYNGYLAVEGTDDDDSTQLDELGFENFGAYAYCQIKDEKSMKAILAYLDSKYYLRSETRNRLQELTNSFHTGAGRKFNIEAAPLADFKNFYRISHKVSGINEKTNKPELKVYPVIIDGGLFLNIDLSTNLVAKRLINKAIPGSRTKFLKADGLWIKFFKNRSEVLAWTKEVRAEGYVIKDLAEFAERVESLQDKLKLIQKLSKS